MSVAKEANRLIGLFRISDIESNTLRLSEPIKPGLLANDFPQRPSFPNPYTSWLKMLAFGAVVGAVGAALSASWGFAQLSARAQGVPSRRTMSTLFAYVTLGVAAFQWMSIWALTSFSPLIEQKADQLRRQSLSHWRTTLIRLLTTASFIILSLRLWGIIGGGFRSSFNGVNLSPLAQESDAIVTILLWVHLRSLAVAQGFEGLVWRSVVVLVGRGGTLVFLFVVPVLFTTAGHPLRLSWEFVNIRYGLAVLWDVIAVLVLLQFATAFLRFSARRGS